MSDDTRAPNTITSLLNKKTLQYDKEENLNGYEISNKSTNFETQPQTTSKPDAISLIRQSRDDHNRSLRAIASSQNVSKDTYFQNMNDSSEEFEDFESSGSEFVKT
ncbi:hypothetical protein QE152_g12492 [Popillia japonica]|uniref:Uncharacterized protein n=1 Tax=Popillia japonica TaxID=7064 RepID=A0AAW1LPQ3_POPJA